MKLDWLDDVRLKCRDHEGRRRFWTQEELAKKLKVSVATISRWETAKNEPDLAALKALQRVFGEPLEEMLGVKLDP